MALRDYCEDYGLTLPQTKGLLTLVREHFSNFDIPEDPRTLLQYNTRIIRTDKDNTDFLWYGVKECLDQICAISKVTELPNEILLTVNIDGLPLFNGSHHLVPVLISTNIHENLVGIVSVFHYKKGKVTSNKMQSIARPFIDEMNGIISTGYRGSKCRVKLVTCDLVQLAELKDITAHGGFHGCPRCNVVGRSVRHVTCFVPDSSVSARTDKTFRARKHTLHHKEPFRRAPKKGGPLSEFERTYALKKNTFEPFLRTF